jgi:hypothetical protein
MKLLQVFCLSLVITILKITDGQGEVSTYKYTFDSWGRLVKVDSDSSFQGVRSLYTYLLIY